MTTSHRVCVAPMMACTDRHDRYLLRLITRRSRLYTEMVTTGALLFGDTEKLLRYDPFEHPVALQIAGSDPKDMAACARLAAEAGYDEVNINIGCPSSRVQAARFGACLMAEPERVADCISAMRGVVDIPVTVKTRTGIDERDSYEELCGFALALAAAGCETFIVHARKAWLQGLSPKQNRAVPPLMYDRVYKLKADFPGLEIIINGGIRDLDAAAVHLQAVDGVMIGRDAYRNPYMLAEVDRRFYAGATDRTCKCREAQEVRERPPDRTCKCREAQEVRERQLTRLEVLAGYLDYAERQIDAGCRLQNLTRHLFGLFQGQPGAKAWRRHLGEKARAPGAGVEVIRQAAALINC